jgi:hypothetical protein
MFVVLRNFLKADTSEMLETLFVIVAPMRPKGFIEPPMAGVVPA